MSAPLTRRGFMRLFGGAAAAIAAPTYFLPPIGGWQSNLIVNPFSKRYEDYLQIADVELIAEPISALLALHYSKRFLETLQRESQFTEFLATGSIPPNRRNKAIQMLRYTMPETKS